MYSLAIGEAHRRADMEQQRDREAAERRREVKGWADAFNALKKEKDELRRQLSDMYSLAIGEAHRRADMEQQRDREAAERRREVKGWADAFNALKKEKDELRRQLSDCERGGRGEDPSQARTVVLDPTDTGAEE